MLLLLVLVVLTTLSLFHAYRGVHTDAVPLKSASAPGVLAVDTAKDALDQAQEGVERDIGTTSAFHTHVSVASQSLARAAGADVTGLTGRQTIQTVTGLIATYSGWIEDAEAQPSGSVLHTAYLTYADSMLGRHTKDPAADATIMGRLSALQDEQLQVVRGQTDFGPLLWLEWSVALALALALLVLLAEAHRYFAARFRRQFNPALLATAVLLAAGVTLLIVFTALTHSGMADARTALSGSLADTAIPRTGAAVSRRLADTGFRAAAADWILVGGLLLGLLVVLGLQPRISEYRVEVVTLKWPRPRTLGVLGVCLVLLAGGGALAVQATGWKGSVTLLANWTGTGTGPVPAAGDRQVRGRTPYPRGLPGQFGREPGARRRRRVRHTAGRRDPARPRRAGRIRGPGRAHPAGRPGRRGPLPLDLGHPRGGHRREAARLLAADQGRPQEHGVAPARRWTPPHVAQAARLPPPGAWAWAATPRPGGRARTGSRTSCSSRPTRPRTPSGPTGI